MKRKKAWKKAAHLVEPIVEKHGLKQYAPGASIFVTGTSVSTPVDQHINHILTVAEWLLEGE